MPHPIPFDALDDRLAFVGTSGSGKTYAAGTCVEALLAAGARVVIVDPLDVWWGLRLNADGKKASPFDVVIFGGKHADMGLTEYSGKVMGETVAGMKESCIVCPAGLKSAAARRRFMLDFLSALKESTDPDKHEPYHVIFDEADLWAPQKPINPQDTMLCHLMEEIIRRGRVQGFVPWLITQRPAVLNKNVLNMALGLVGMMLPASQDRKALAGWFDGQGDAEEGKRILAALPGLQVGEGIVYLPRQKMLETVTFPKKETFDSSATPKRGEKRVKRDLKPLDIEALRGRLAEVDREMKENDPSALRAEIAKLRQQAGAQKPAAPDPAKIAAIEDKAYVRGKKDGYSEGIYHGWWAASEQLDQKLEGLKLGVVPDRVIQGHLDAVKKRQEAPVAPPPNFITTETATPRAPVKRLASTTTDADLTGPQKVLLGALAWWKSMGHDAPTRPQIAAMAGWKSKSSHLKNRLTELVGKGLVNYPSSGRVSLTHEGAAAAPAPDTSLTVIDSVRAVLTNPQQQIFDYLVEMGRVAVLRSDIASAVGWEPTSSHLKNRLTELSQREIVEYPERGTVRLQEWVFS